MVAITLPDGSQKQFEGAVSVADIAASIGAGLAKAALGGEIEGKLVDLSHTITDDATVRIITAKDDEGLEIIRHSTAHLLAQAVKQLYPEAQVTIGPVIEDGFYYDFSYERGFTPEDMEKIEAKMKQLAKAGDVVERSEMARDDAVKFFRDMGEEYKAKIIEDIPANETLSLYKQGDFVDLCRGPHVPNTKHLKAFKLTKLAGAYWRGDSNNEMLQRVYGTAWADKASLDAYLHRIEEAEKRDHRKLAKQMDLFHVQGEAPGMVFWHANGWAIYQVMEQYIRDKLVEHDYQEIRTPQMVERTLWEKSGHWAKYRENMFCTESEHHIFAIKPMSCPCHVQVFNQGLKSYRDLPIRMAEFGNCHRNEFSGTLHGLMRVRNFTQDDAHIFCTEEQLQAETASLIDLVFEIYEDFGFTSVQSKLSTRPEQRVGSDEVWDRAEQALQQALEAKGIPWELCPGDGAFYGPKIDFVLEDCLQRHWQCGTIQLDFQMPGRLDAEYVNEEGNRTTPVMIHRAILGSIERFMGVLIENYAGKFPVWLAPTQVVLMNISEKQTPYVEKIAEILKKRRVRVKTDLRNEKIGFKIREHTLQKVPYLLVVGDKEVESEQLSVRLQDGQELGSMSLDDFCTILDRDIARRGRTVSEE